MEDAQKFEGKERLAGESEGGGYPSRKRGEGVSEAGGEEGRQAQREVGIGIEEGFWEEQTAGDGEDELLPNGGGMTCIPRAVCGHRNWPEKDRKRKEQRRKLEQPQFRFWVILHK